MISKVIWTKREKTCYDVSIKSDAFCNYCNIFCFLRPISPVYALNCFMFASFITGSSEQLTSNFTHCTLAFLLPFFSAWTIKQHFICIVLLLCNKLRSFSELFQTTRLWDELMCEVGVNYSSSLWQHIMECLLAPPEAAQNWKYFLHNYQLANNRRFN